MTDLTKIEKLFGMLDEETQAALRALPKGEVQVFNFNGIWKDLANPKWTKNMVYRQKPKPPALVVPNAVWAVLPPEYKWAAGDADGEVYAHDMQPTRSSLHWDLNERSAQINRLVGVTFDKERWTESLIQRPEGV